MSRACARPGRGGRAERRSPGAGVGRRRDGERGGVGARRQCDGARHRARRIGQRPGARVAPPVERRGGTARRADGGTARDRCGATRRPLVLLAGRHRLRCARGRRLRSPRGHARVCQLRAHHRPRTAAIHLRHLPCEWRGGGARAAGHGGELGAVRQRGAHRTRCADRRRTARSRGVQGAVAPVHAAGVAAVVHGKRGVGAGPDDRAGRDGGDRERRPDGVSRGR